MKETLYLQKLDKRAPYYKQGKIVDFIHHWALLCYAESHLLMKSLPICIYERNHSQPQSRFKHTMEERKNKDASIKVYIYKPFVLYHACKLQ